VLTLAEIPAFWIDAVYGAIILIALVVSRVTGGTAEET
jgi:simple sugar transport system permease protein